MNGRIAEASGGGHRDLGRVENINRSQRIPGRCPEVRQKVQNGAYDYESSPAEAPIAEAKRLWRKLQSDFVTDCAAGKLILQSALEAFGRVQEARAPLKKEGSVTKDRWGQSKQYPDSLVEALARA